MANFKESIDAILVPQGQEYQAVCRGMEGTSRSLPIFAIPVGTRPSIDYLTKLFLEPPGKPLSNFLVCGLCGSLSERYNVGDVLIYRNYTYNLESDLTLELNCDEIYIEYLQSKIKQKTFLVRGLTSDRVVCRSSEKLSLARKYQVEAIDMEGFVVQKTLQELGNARLATIRIVSDDSMHDIPDLSRAISGGKILPIPLAIAMLRQPIAATRLISGSLRGLKVLETVIRELFT